MVESGLTPRTGYVLFTRHATLVKGKWVIRKLSRELIKYGLVLLKKWIIVPSLQTCLTGSLLIFSQLSSLSKYFHIQGYRYFELFEKSVAKLAAPSCHGWCRLSFLFTLESSTSPSPIFTFMSLWICGRDWLWLMWVARVHVAQMNRAEHSWLRILISGLLQEPTAEQQDCCTTDAVQAWE